MTAPVWFTAADIARLQGLAVVTVRNLASRHKWRTLGTRPQRYHIHDVMTTLGTANSRPK